MQTILKRRRYVSGAEKIHTSVYLLPRHRAHLEFLMRARGCSMNDAICSMIDESIKKFKTDRKDSQL
jgi:macrodomain Ter protein organizer (MatP/YcbG family)